jgi:hypothetical protein
MPSRADTRASSRATAPTGFRALLIVAAAFSTCWLGARAAAEPQGAGTTTAHGPVAHGPVAHRPAAFAPAPGQPFPGLSAPEIERFERGRNEFERARSLEAGLGPLFNDSACNRCHNRRGVGGAGIQSAIMAGRLLSTRCSRRVGR